MKARHAGFLAAGTALLLDQVTKGAALAQLEAGTPVLWLLVARPPRLPLHAASFGLILGGASGNLLDRLLHSGAVVDFLDVGTASWRWPTFNVADAAISIGAVVLLLFGPKGKRIEGE
jgi:signal peptidase II